MNGTASDTRVLVRGKDAKRDLKSKEGEGETSTSGARKKRKRNRTRYSVCKDDGGLR
jgi:hypothetical protein